MENLSPQEEKEEELYLTDYMKKELRGAASWGFFISISMITFFGIYFLTILSSISGLPVAGATAGLIGIILLVAFLGLILGMGIFLFLFSTNLKKALIQTDSRLFTNSLDFLSRYFILSFVILIVILIFSFIITTLNF